MRWILFFLIAVLFDLANAQSPQIKFTYDFETKETLPNPGFSDQL